MKTKVQVIEEEDSFEFRDELEGALRDGWSIEHINSFMIDRWTTNFVAVVIKEEQ